MTVEMIPILPSRDFDETLAFWSLLGFEEAGRWPESYLILHHATGIELHFFWSKRLSVRTNDHGAYVRFDTASAFDDLYALWAALDLGDGRVTVPDDMDYGLRVRRSGSDAQSRASRRLPHHLTGEVCPEVAELLL